MRQHTTIWEQNKRSAGLCAALLATLLASTTAQAQDSGNIPAQPSNAAGVQPRVGAPQPGGPQGGPPPLPVLLGYAGFMLTLDRPWKAEQLYKTVLMIDPNNAAAQTGLQDARNQQHIGFATLVHSYYDSKDVQMLGYGGGPIINTPSGKITITVGNGYYKNNNNKNNAHNPQHLLPTIPTAEDNFALHKKTFNLQYEPFWGKNMQNEASFWASWQTYDFGVPDRFLYDARYSYIPKLGRERFTVGTGRKDSFYSNQLNQFLAPETFFQLKKKILFYDTYAGVDYPLSFKWDFSFNTRYFSYTDDNRRYNFRTLFMYRIKPDTAAVPMPIWRVGLDGIIDEGRFFTLDYGIPRDFRSLSAATDFTVLAPQIKMVLYFSYPIAEKNFAAPLGVVAYVSKTLDKEKRFELYGKSIILNARNISTSLYDHVIGLNTRF